MAYEHINFRSALALATQTSCSTSPKEMQCKKVWLQRHQLLGIQPLNPFQNQHRLEAAVVKQFK